MKPIKYSLLALIISLIAISCNDDNDNDEADTDTNSTKDNTLSRKMMDDVFNQFDNQARKDTNIRSSTSSSLEFENQTGCPDVTVEVSDSPSTDNPHRVILDYKSSGCIGNDQRERKGRIVATLTGRYRDSGTVINISTENYFVDDHSVEGERIVTNMGHNSDGNLWYDIEINDVTIITSDEKDTLTWQSNRTREWIEGESTKWDPFDDVYLIEGTASGVNRNNVAYEMDITKPLRIEMGCFHIVSGKIEINPDGFATREIDYGSACDGNVTITVDGNSFEITV